MVLFLTRADWGVAPSNPYLVPANGNELVRVALRYENHGAKTQSVNPFDFKLRDANGVERGYFIYEPNFDASDLAAGGSLSGTLSFPAAPNTSKGVLIWHPALFSDTYYYLPIGG